MTESHTLVTGGFGFIGSNFVRQVLEQENGVTILNLDNLSDGSDPRNLSNLGGGHLKNIRGDLNDLSLLKKTLKNADAVVNFAAYSHVDTSIRNPRLFFESNAKGTFNLIESIRRYNDNLRMVHVSTDEVYGEALGEPFTETARLNPSNPYSATKAASDMLVQAYVRTFGLNFSITRCTNNFGPFQSPEKMIPKCIISSILDTPIPVYGKGHNIRDWLYVADHCHAVSLVLKKGKRGSVYNISAGNETENIDLVSTILRLMKKSDELMKFVADRPGHDIRYSLDSSKVRKELGWKPRFAFEESLRRTISWYETNRSWWKAKLAKYVLRRNPWESK